MDRTPSLRRLSTPREERNRSTGFTLIELLVVIAIIMILAGMLLPTFGRAKAAAQEIACMSNLRQIAIATMTYSLDNKNHIPSFRTWLHRKQMDLSTGVLYPHLASKGVFMCPTDKRTLLAKGRRDIKTVPMGMAMTGKNKIREYSYGMNCILCHTTDLSQFRNPSATMVYIEAPFAPNDGGARVGGPTARGANAVRALAFRHNRKGHLVLGDLRVQSMNQKQYDEAQSNPQFWDPKAKPPKPKPGS